MRATAGFLGLVTAAAKYEAGAVVRDAVGRKFRYVRFKTAVVKGDVLGSASTSTATGAAQFAGFRASKNASAPLSELVLGVAIGTASASNYGWIQTGGPLGAHNSLTTYIKTDKSVGAYEGCIKDQATAAMADTITRSLYGSQSAWIFCRSVDSDSGSFLVKGFLIDRLGG